MIISSNMLAQLLAPLEEAVNNRDTRLSRYAERQKILGWFCTYTPHELLYAARFLPVRIRGGQISIERANALTPSFICPYMRASLERAMRGEYKYLSGLVQGYTCDVPCGMINIWEENIGGGLYHTVPLPYNTSTEARAYFRQALNELIEKLDTIGGKYSDSALGASLDLYRNIRLHLLKLHDLRRQKKLPLSARQFYTIVEAGFSMPPEEYRAGLSELIRGLAETADRPEGLSLHWDKADRAKAPSLQQGLPVMVSGSLIEDMGVYDTLEEAGLRIIADDLCSGYRCCDPADGQGTDPLDRLIDRYMNRFPCPARSDVDSRAARILQRAREAGAKGVIFILQKFCTPHLADIPALTGLLQHNGIQTLVVELDEAGGSQAQMKTRFEAFREMAGS